MNGNFGEAAVYYEWKCISIEEGNVLCTCVKIIIYIG